MVRPAIRWLGGVSVGINMNVDEGAGLQGEVWKVLMSKKVVQGWGSGGGCGRRLVEQLPWKRGRVALDKIRVRDAEVASDAGADTQGSCSDQAEDIGLECRADFKVGWNRSTTPLA